MSKAQNKQQSLRCNMSWTEPHLAAYACKYLNSGEFIDKRTGLQLALACLYGPLGLANSGGTADEVEIAISKAQMIFESQMANTRLLMNTMAPQSNNSATAAPQSVNAVSHVPPPAQKGWTIEDRGTPMPMGDDGDDFDLISLDDD